MKLKDYLFVIIMVIISNLQISALVSAEANDRAEKGVFPVQGFESLLALDGEWEFYWKELFTPKDLHNLVNQSKFQFVMLPHQSHGFEIGGKVISKTGYGTYRLHLQFPDSELGKVKALYLPSISSAYVIWIDGEIVARNGTVGKSRELMKPAGGSQIVKFQVERPTVELVIQVSNFYQRKAGIFDSILLAEIDTVYQYQNDRALFRTAVIMSLIIMGLYHLSLFAFWKHERALVYFGLLCLVLALRTALLEDTLAGLLLTYIDWEIANKLEYLGAILGVLFLTLFTHGQFPKDMSQRWKKFIIILTLLYSSFIIVTPAVVFTQMLYVMGAMIILNFIYLFYVYFKAFGRKREGSKLNMMAMVFLFGAAFNDIIFYSSVVNTMELTSVGMLFFLFTQSLILSKKSAAAFVKSESLSRELKMLNASLEQKVEERTEQLHKTNKELQTMNDKLNQAHQSRSRLISNITHEIATPLTSIQAYAKGLLDGVLQNNKKYFQLIYEKSLYITQMLQDLRAVTDIETRQIQFKLEKEKIENYMKSIYEKYKFEVEKQGISFEYCNRLGGIEEPLYCKMDSIRIEQVIVNFISNAQRFVGEDGKITIVLDRQATDSIVVKVIDNGIGISEEEAEFVFERFYSNRYQGKHHNGSGLGLSISKEIVEYHGGTIGVSSKVGEGSCFYFTLPIMKK